MKQEDKLRNALREYYDTQPAPVSDNEWEQASAYLTAARRKNRMKRSILIFTVLVSALSLFLFNLPKSTTPQKYQSSLHSKKAVKSASVSHPVVLDAPMVTVQKNTFQSSAKKERTSSKANSNSGVESRENGLPAQTILSTPPITQMVEADVAEPPLALITPSVSAAADTHAEGAIRQEEPADPKDNAVVVSPPAEDRVPPPKQDPITEMPPTQVNPLPQKVPLAVNAHKKEQAAADSVKLTVPKEDVIGAAEFASPAPGVSTGTEESEWDTLPEPKFIHLADQGIYYEAGAAWSYGWQGAAKRDARGFSPVFGINYMNRLSNHYALSFGLQYLQVTKLSNSSKTSSVSSYVYGEESTVTVITPTTLHYLVLPLRFHYYVNRRNSFGGGVNLAYLLNVGATVTSYDESAGLKGNYKTVKQGGYNEGFSWFDAQLALFYRRRIGRSLALQAEIFFGLTDVKQNEFFGLNQKERNSGAKLSLVYFPFRKKDR